MRAYIWKWIGSALLLIISALCGAGLALAALLGTAFFTAWLPALWTAAALAFVLPVFFAGRWLARRAPARPVWAAAAALMALAAAGVYGFVLRPGPQAAAPAPRADAQIWELSTGARIAYTYYPASGQPRPAPIVYLHGGPGAMPHGEGWGDDYGFMRQFTADGFDVYLYDQAGSGGSALRPRLGDYSVANNVADLEAIRQKIGAEKMILVGQSWGGALAANYLARYPLHVERVVFTSPGEMWASPENPRSDYSATAGGPIDIDSTPRLELALLLLDINPEAAQSLLPQREVNAFIESQTQNLLAQSFCQRDAARVPRLDPAQPLGFNLYAIWLTEDNQAGLSDPRPALAALDTPALILKGECDGIPLELTQEYAALPHAQLARVMGAGHLIWGSQWDLATRAIRAFLNDEPLPADPRLTLQ